MGTSPRPKSVAREPVRIKVYGLVYMTRQGYLILLGIGLVLAFGLIAARLSGLIPVAPVEQRTMTIYDKLAYTLFGNLHWIVLGALMLGGIEALFVLRRFAHEELLQRALLDDQPAPASEPPQTPVAPEDQHFRSSDERERGAGR